MLARSMDLLQRQEVGIQFTQHIGDSSRVVPPVNSDAAVDVIRGQCQSHILLRAYSPLVRLALFR